MLRDGVLPGVPSVVMFKLENKGGSCEKMSFSKKCYSATLFVFVWIQFIILLMYIFDCLRRNVTNTFADFTLSGSVFQRVETTKRPASNISFKSWNKI